MLTACNVIGAFVLVAAYVAGLLRASGISAPIED